MADVDQAWAFLTTGAFVGRALLASPDHHLRGTRLPLKNRAGRLQAARLVTRHLVAGRLLGGAPSGQCGSVLARLFFAARHKMMLQLMRLVSHAAATRRLFSHGLLSSSPRGGAAAAALRQEAPTGAGQERPARGLPSQLPAPGTQGALCLDHGAPSCHKCRSLGWGINRCCRAGHEGHAGSAVGPRCPTPPPRLAPGRKVLVP